MSQNAENLEPHWRRAAIFAIIGQNAENLEPNWRHAAIFTFFGQNAENLEPQWCGAPKKRQYRDFSPQKSPRGEKSPIWRLFGEMAIFCVLRRISPFRQTFFDFTSTHLIKPLTRFVELLRSTFYRFLPLTHRFKVPRSPSKS